MLYFKLSSQIRAHDLHRVQIKPIVSAYVRSDKFNVRGCHETAFSDNKSQFTTAKAWSSDYLNELLSLLFKFFMLFSFEYDKTVSELFLNVQPD